MRANRSEGVKPLNRKPSEYLRENFWYTNSGMAWEPSVSFVQNLMGFDRVMYAMDYPYQFLSEEVSAMDNLPITDEQKKMFFQTNAENLFKL